MKGDLNKMISWEAECGRGRKWEKLRFRELNFRPLEIEMLTGQLSKLLESRALRAEQGSGGRSCRQDPVPLERT